MRIFLSVMALGFLMTACAPMPLVQPPLEKIIWTPQTDFGNTIKNRYSNEFSKVVERFTTEAPRLIFSENGIAITYVKDDQPTIYRLQLNLVHDITYNTRATHFPQRAATTLFRSLYPVLRILNDQQGIMSEPDIGGIILVVNWKITDFVSDPYKFHGQAEGISVYIKKQDLAEFSTGKLTIQELGRRADFYTGLGKIEIDFSSVI